MAAIGRASMSHRWRTMRGIGNSLSEKQEIAGDRADFLPLTR